jgi:hypothetical protein
MERWNPKRIKTLGEKGNREKGDKGIKESIKFQAEP